MQNCKLTSPELFQSKEITSKSGGVKYIQMYKRNTHLK